MQEATIENHKTPNLDIHFSNIAMWTQEHTALITTIIIAACLLVSIFRKEKIKEIIGLILKDTYYRRVLLITIPVVVTALLYIYPTSISAYIILLGYVTSLAVSEKASSIAVEKKESECKGEMDSSVKENEMLKNIINNKKTYFIDKILSRLQHIQSNKKLKTKDDVTNELSKLSHGLMAEKTMFESADEALSNYNIETNEGANLAEKTIIE